MYSDYEPIDVSFINGYLAPLSLLMDYVTLEVGFTYYFRELTPDEDCPLLDSIRRAVRESIIAFHKANRRQLDVNRIDRILEVECRLEPLEHWQTAINERLSSWVAQPVIDGLHKVAQTGIWPPSLLVDDFTEVLKTFFSKATECFTLAGEITGELHIHWSGLSGDDFFFEDSGRQYHLHFDLCD